MTRVVKCLRIIFKIEFIFNCRFAGKKQYLNESMKFKSAFSFRLEKIIKPDSGAQFGVTASASSLAQLSTLLRCSLLSRTLNALFRSTCIPSHVTPSLPNAPPFAGVRSSPVDPNASHALPQHQLRSA